MLPQAGSPSSRINVIDALRGIALCGILLINIPSMAWLMDSHEPVRGVRDGGLSTFLWWVQMLFVNGTMRGLFSLLFGASMLLFLAKAERGSATRSQANRLMLRRLFWLFVFGVVDMTLLLWPGDILSIYALAGLIALPFAIAGKRTLAIGAAIILVGTSALMVYEELPKREAIAHAPALEQRAAAGATLSESEQKDLDRLTEWRTGRAPAGEAAAERKARLGNYTANLTHLSKVSWEYCLDWKDTIRWVFDAVGFMLIGMLLFRLGWLRAEASARTYLALVVIGYGIGLPLKAIEAVADWRLIIGVQSPSFVLFWLPAATMQAARLLVTLGHLGLFMTCWNALGWRFRPFEALGRMAFTGYLMQSMLAALAFSGFGLGLWGRLDLAQLWLAAATIWAIEIAFSMAWLSRFSMGPFEWIWRALTYGQAPGRLRLPQPTQAPA